MTVSKPKPSDATIALTVRIAYHLHCKGTDISALASSLILSADSLCPPYDACPNQNIFQQLFGVTFHCEGHTYVCPISSHKFAWCFQLSNNIQYRLSHDSYKHGLDATMPGRTSAWLFQEVYNVIINLCDSNTKIISICGIVHIHSNSSQWYHLYQTVIS